MARPRIKKPEPVEVDLGFAKPYFNNDLTVKDQIGLDQYLQWHTLPNGYVVINGKLINE